MPATERTMTLDEAIETLMEHYREWLDEHPQNVATDWLERFGEDAILEDDGEEFALRVY